MDSPRIICVLSNPRSGSTALRSALCTGGALRDFGEIFHHDPSQTAFPFLEFLRRWPDPVGAMLDYEGCIALARAYLDQLAFEAQGVTPVIDIKHNAWGVLRPLWQFPHDRPRFLAALRARRAVFIFLRRANLGDQVISYHIANHTNIWHAEISMDDIPAQIRGRNMDLGQASEICSLFEQAERLVARFCDNYPQIIRLTYETVFEGGVLAADAAEALSQVLGTTITPVDLPFRPNRADKRQVVANYDQICDIAEKIRRSPNGTL